MKTNKLRVIQDLEKLSPEIQEQIKLVYPNGYSQHLIEFTNRDNQLVYGLPFETDEKIYMIRMSVKKAIQLIEDDADYDSNGNLKDRIREQYEDSHSDVDYLSENDNYDDPIDEIEDVEDIDD